MRSELHFHHRGIVSCEANPRRCYIERGIDDLSLVVRSAVARGIGILALTDHNTSEHVERFQDAARVVDPSLIVVPGVEISAAVRRKGKLVQTPHILGYWPDKVPNKLPLYEPPQVVINEIALSGGVAVAAHVGADVSYSLTLGQCDQLRSYHALEVGGGWTGISLDVCDFATRGQYGMTVGSDAHTLEQLFWMNTGFPESCRTPTDVINCIRTGQTEVQSSVVFRERVTSLPTYGLYIARLLWASKFRPWLG